MIMGIKRQLNLNEIWLAEIVSNSIESFKQNRIKQDIRVRQDLNANTSLPQLLVLLLQRLDTHSIRLNLHLEHAILLKQRINALLELLSRCRHIRGTTTIRHHHGHMVMSTASCHALIYRARITL